MVVMSNSGQSQRPVQITRAASGAGMDRVIEKKRLPIKSLMIGLGITALVAALLWYLDEVSGGRSLVVENNRIVISPVTEGLYEDFIPIRAQVTPRKTVYLDVIEGGRVEEKLVEDGALVKAGELIVVLSNTSMQLDLTRNEAMVTEQLNNKSK